MEELSKAEGKEVGMEPEIRVVAHCLLNPSTRVKGLKAPEFHLHPEAEGPLIQLPCPEALYMGLDRWAVTRNQMDVPEFRRFCRSLITHYVDLLEMLARQGARIRILGVAGSPSCGVSTTTKGYQGGKVKDARHEHVSGTGVFMEELFAELKRREVPFECEEVA
jgi:predicted secreted protein